MKCTVQLLKFTGIITLCGGLMFACQKKNVIPGGPANPAGSNMADTISNHLQFFNATKKQGSSPKGPAGSTLKISFEDTLYLVDEIKRPIKFLHMDTTKNVAGIYLQVHFPAGSSSSTSYYDIPEVPDMADGDTVSVIMIGINPTGLSIPQIFDVTITPYDKKGQPLAEATRPVKIDKPANDPNGNGNSCGLVLPAGEQWDWVGSYILTKGSSTNFDFYNQPGKVFSGGGQDIEGSCCNGKSTWPQFCLGERTHNSKLHFATYYRINFEHFLFFNNGNFFRQTMEDSPVPLPDSSNFCSGGAGRLLQSLKHTQYYGKWTTSPAMLPPDLQYLAGKLQLALKGDSSKGTAYGNPGGVIQQLDCKSLVLVQVDKEGAGKHLFKFYVRRKSGDVMWYKFN